MVFASLIFICFFLPLNLILYYAYDNITYRNILLTAFSLVFYAWGEPIWVLLLLFTAALDYGNALLIERFRDTRLATLGIWFSVTANLGLLMSFKYSGFIVENFNFLFGTTMHVPSIALPIGISFYTFQTISYVIDVYRGEAVAQRKFLNFLMFVSMYQQLVAGPIVRYVDIMNEVEQRDHNLKLIWLGIQRFTIGLFKKVCIANVAAEFVARYLDGDLSQLSVGEAWFGILMFSVQIYFDFSGYSDMAIGLGKMFGFHFLENFNYPYISRSATEFWRRWHMSLGSFFRDYVYIPLGGKARRPYFNLMVVWFLTGLWHGASWNFILWGLYFGCLILIERLFLFKILDNIPRIFGHLYLLFMAILGWALFYFVDLHRLMHFFGILFGQAGAQAWNYELTIALQENVFWLIIALILCLPIYPWAERKAKELVHRFSVIWLMATAFQIILFVMSITMLVGKTYNPFIYYRF